MQNPNVGATVSTLDLVPFSTDLTRVERKKGGKKAPSSFPALPYNSNKSKVGTD